MKSPLAAQQYDPLNSLGGLLRVSMLPIQKKVQPFFATRCFVAVATWPRVIAILAALILVAVSTLYVVTNHHLNTARITRRNEDCAAAEHHLAACWPLPGFAAALKFEDDL